MQSDNSEKQVSAAELVARFALEPHPEGGWYREVFRSGTLLSTGRGPRAALTSIYFLLESHQHSRWHVVTSDESWHHAGGAPLELLVYAPASGKLQRRVLGPLHESHEPLGVVNAGEWQAARSLGTYSLLNCDVAPGFEFEDFTFIAAVPGHERAFAGELAAFRSLL